MSKNLQTALYGLHQQLGARMVPFAGYAMPLQYTGIISEHQHTRRAAGLFDVSHIGQCVLSGPDVTAQLESLLTADLAALAINQQVYSLFTTASGGILDDLIVCRWAEDTFLLVVNAACKAADFERLARLANCELRLLDEQALLALQGPAAREVLTALNPAAADLTFMHGSFMALCGARCYVSCSGYSGEDGYEISCPNAAAETIAQALLAHETVQAVGLGARDSLRLEAGLCLYGHDLNANTTPVEAGLAWAVAAARRQQANFPGAAIINAQLQNGPQRRRIGLSAEGRAPVREGATVFADDGREVGRVSSGGFAPSLGHPIAMAYVESHWLQAPLHTVLRGKTITLTPCKMPFIRPRYYRG